MGNSTNTIMSRTDYLECLEALYKTSKKIAEMIIEKPWRDDEWASLIEFKRAIEAVGKAPKLVH